ncbi:MAG: S1C family serine protease [Chitinophagales bacterium]
MNLYKLMCVLLFATISNNVLLVSQVDTLNNYSEPLLLNAGTGHLPTQNPIISNIGNDSLSIILSGVKYVIVELTAPEQSMADLGKYPIIAQFADYLKGMGFKEVAYRTNDKRRLLLSVPTYCDLIRVRFSLMPKEDYYEGVQLQFQTCRNDYSVLTYKEKFYKNEHLLQNLNRVWALFYDNKIQYNIENRLKVKPNVFVTNEENILTYLKQNAFNLDSIEGIYEKVPDYDYSKKKYSLAIVKNKEQNYDVVYIRGASNYLDWKEGEWMGEIKVSAKPRVFEEVKWVTPNKLPQTNGRITLGNGKNFFLRFKRHVNVYEYKRLDNTTSITNTATLDGEGMSGSGILIDTRGYLLTNYDVVRNAKRIHIALPKPEVEGQDIWLAKLVSVDEKTDLALLQIIDRSFNPPDVVPYLIEDEEIEVGEKVFTLGYPLVESMGVHSKLAVGSISSLHGYQSLVSTYQTTVQVYAGNSGSPLFNEQGKLVGILRNKHADAVKASYALKSIFILQFLNQTGLFNSNHFLAAPNNLEMLPLTEQIKKIQPFVYYINSY